MKKSFLISLTLLLASIVSGQALAQDQKPVEYNGLYYFLNDEDLTATVTNGYGGYIDNESQYDELRYQSRTIGVPSTIWIITDSTTWQGKEYTVTKIGQYAFNWTSATKITLPSTITYIDEYAFYWSNALREISIPSSVKQIAQNNFIGCGSLKRVIFEESTETLDILVASDNAVPFQASPINTFKMMRPFNSHGYNIMRYKPIEKLFLGKNITEIADYTFADLSSQYTQIFAYGEKAPKCDTTAFAGQEIVEVYIKDELRQIYEFMELILMHNFTDSAEVKAAGYYDGFWGYIYYGTAGEFGGSSDYYEYQEAYYDADKDRAIVWDMMTQGNEEKDSLRIVICDGRYLWLERYAYDKVRVVQPKIKYEGWGERPFNALYLGGKYVIPDSVDFPIERYDPTTGNHSKTDYVRCAIEEIGFDAFYGSKLEEVVMSKSLKTIGVQAFMNCRNLRHIDFPDNIETIWDGAFADPGRYEDDPGGLTGTVVLPKNLKHLGDYVFRTCEYLTGIEFPSTLDTIPGYCFWGCTRLNNVVVPGTVKTILPGAFSRCESLSKITLEEGIETLSYDIFPACPFSELIIPASVTMIEPGMLSRIGNEWGEPTLTHLVVKEGNRVYDSRNGCNAIIETATNTLVAGTGASFIPATVDSIASNAFSELSMQSVTLPKNLKKIQPYAFNAYLTKVVSEIEEPAGVLDMDGFNVFNQQCTLYVPAGTKAKYMADDAWQFFGEDNIIEAKPVTINDITTTTETADVTFTSVTDETDLTNAIIDNLYVTCDTTKGDTYDKTEQAFVFQTTVSEEAIAALMETGGLSDVIQNIFSGIVMQVKAGEGTLTITAKTTGARVLAISVAGMETQSYTQDTKGEVKFNYNVDNDSYIFIYGSDIKIAPPVYTNSAKIRRIVANDSYRSEALQHSEMLPTIRRAPQAEEATGSVSIYGVKREVKNIIDGVENLDPETTATRKVVRDGQVLIIRDGKTYNILGTEIQ